jgi:hypothetical protein
MFNNHTQSDKFLFTDLFKKLNCYRGEEQKRSVQVHIMNYFWSYLTNSVIYNDFPDILQKTEKLKCLKFSENLLLYDGCRNVFKEKLNQSNLLLYKQDFEELEKTYPNIIRIKKLYDSVLNDLKEGAFDKESIINNLEYYDFNKQYIDLFDKIGITQIIDNNNNQTVNIETIFSKRKNTKKTKKQKSVLNKEENFEILFLKFINELQMKGDLKDKSLLEDHQLISQANKNDLNNNNY